jgi:hypothetical protein
MRLRRTVAVGAMLLLVAATTGWLVVRSHEPATATAAGPASSGTPTVAVGVPTVGAAAAAATDSTTPAGEDRAQASVRGAAATDAADPSPAAGPSPVARGTGSFSWARWGDVPGSRTSGGTPVRVAFEVEGGLGLDGAETASSVAQILVDERGWQTERDVRFVFVTTTQARRGEYDIRIGIASRRTTTDLCAPLDTEGYTSCYNGRVVINLDRWMLGIDAYEGRLDEYRTYVVDHEVGHALGLGHATCPEKGAPAPVMVPQTLHLWGCTPNPYPVVG